MPRKLKVFCTPIGFHDAYVAAPSRKAALAAWGSSADLFARGVAAEVTDAALAKAPLAAPGTIVKVARGSVDDHLAALPAGKAKRAPGKARLKPNPRPDRTPRDAAERALAAATADYAKQERALAAREAALGRERAAFDRARDRALDTLTAARDAADERYRRALVAWAP